MVRCALLLVFPLLGWTQPPPDKSGAIRARVVDASGHPLLPTFRIQAQSGAKPRYEGTGNTSGEFLADHIQSGEYAVTVSCAGFRDKTLLNVHVAPGDQVDLGEFRLEIGGCNTPGVICDDFGLSLYEEPAHAQGVLEIPTLCAVDIDEGKVTCTIELDGRGTLPARKDANSDFWLKVGKKGELIMSAWNGVTFALNPPVKPSRSGCASASYTSSDVRIDGLPLGSLLCIHTNLGRNAALLFLNSVPSGAERVKAHFVTWQGKVDIPTLQITPRQ
jgi:hypothetical protein